jgi:C1A family cysteine protease
MVDITDKDIPVRQTKGFGWIPDLPDRRDYLFIPIKEILLSLPPSVDLREQQQEPPIYDQGSLGSCTANAIGGALEFLQIKQQNKEIFTPSRLFVYYNERVVIGTVDYDSGAYIRDGIKSVADLGACPEEDWAYDISKFTQKPYTACYEHAMSHQAIVYSRVNRNLNDMKACIAAGYPFVLGFTCYESLMSNETTSTGAIKMPGSGESTVGGHAILAVGYDDEHVDGGGRFIIRNSWGESWGRLGYGSIPYAYLTDPNLSDDFWTIRTVESGEGEVVNV